MQVASKFRGQTNKRKSLRRGGTLVELALSFVVLTMMVFGVAEMGFLFHDESSVANAARVAARAYAVGDTPTTAISMGQSGAQGIISSNVSISLYYSTDSGNTWTQDTGGANDAPSGSLVKANAQYTHNYPTAIMTSSKSVVININQVMQREQ